MSYSRTHENLYEQHKISCNKVLIEYEVKLTETKFNTQFHNVKIITQRVLQI